MKNYVVGYVSDYVQYRIKQMKDRENPYKLVFKSPLALKYQNEILFEFNACAIIRAVKRRIYKIRLRVF